MSWTTDLRTGCAETLHAAGAGTWRDDGTAYLPGETAIVRGRLQETPDRQIALNVYGPITDNSASDVTYGIQALVRGDAEDPDSVDTVADAVFDALDGLEHITWGSVEISQVIGRPGTDLGPDSSDRYERTLNFHVQAQRTSALRTE
ncbi:hypothetical protein GCM10027447_12410 [Glycomyces halotolerans]